jgi:hypothetical protein
MGYGMSPITHYLLPIPLKVNELPPAYYGLLLVFFVVKTLSSASLLPRPLDSFRQTHWQNNSEVY